MVYIRLLLLCISICGYFLFLNKKNVEVAVIPIVTFSSIGLLMFFAGLLNVMVATTYLLFLLGIVLCFVSKPWKLLSFRESKRFVVVLSVFIFLSILLLIRLYGMHTLHYDSYSHWLTVVKEMVLTDRMPNFQSTTIMFEGYPTGVAGFIYYISKITGVFRDDIVMFSQAILTLSAAFSVVAFIKKPSVPSVIVAVAFIVFCFSADNSFNELCVDTLISVLSLSVIIIVCYYVDDYKKGILLAIPSQMFLIAVKNSGILMVGINLLIIFLIYFYYYNKKTSFLKRIKKPFLISSIFLICPIIVYYLWSQHIKMVFDNGIQSKHTASFKYYSEMFLEKSSSQVEEIISRFIERMFSWNTTWILLIIIFVILILCYIFLKREHRNRTSYPLVSMFSIIFAYFVFMAILGAMYLFSMPYYEAESLSCYDRYEGTIIIYIVGICAATILIFLNIHAKKSQRLIAKAAVLCILFVSMLLTYSKQINSVIQKGDEYDNSFRALLEKAKDVYNIEDGSSYLVVVDSGSKDYDFFVSQYVFWSPNVLVCRSDDIISNVSDYKYVIAIDSNVNISSIVDDSYNKIGNNVYSR